MLGRTRRGGRRSAYDFIGRMGFTSFRELTRAELRDVRRLASGRCANYDYDFGCLMLDGQCYMMYGAVYTCSALCKYFSNAVLPLEPQLDALFNGENIADQTKSCVICGTELFVSGNNAKYCVPCARHVHRRQKNESDRKRRSKTDK